MMWIDRIEFHKCRFSSCGGHHQVLSGSIDSAPIFHLGSRHHTGASFAFMYNIFKHQYNLYPKFLNIFSLCSQLRMLESVHRPIALKSSLSGGILESMYVMDCAPSVRAVLSPLSGSAFLQVTPLFCLIVYQIAL